MSGRRGVVRIAVALVLVVAAFYAGTRYQKHRPELRALVTGLAGPKPAAALVAARPDGVTPQAASPSRRTLDTTLLPLLVDTVAIPPALGVHAGAGGAITAVKDTIVIVDVQGAFFRADAKGATIAKLDLPPLPNHAAEYEQFAPKTTKVRGFLVNFGFVVHDLESRQEPGGIRLFVSYERYLRDLNTTALAVSTILLAETDFRPLGSWEDVYQGQPLAAEWYSGIAGGGRMVVRGDDLYLTVGDYNQDNVFMASRLEAQNRDSDFGKILKIDLRTKAKTILTIGHRNPQGLAVTPQGTIYATEHGPRGGDKLNVIVPGRNYGWPVTSLGTHYTTYDWPNSRLDAGQEFDPPLFAWVPSIGISNLIEVAGFHPAWDNDLLVASLKAQSLFRLRRDAEGHVVYCEPIPLDQRLRDIATLPDGTLVLWTDEAKLLFVSVDQTKLAANRRSPR